MNISQPICLCQKELNIAEVDPGDVCRNCIRELIPDIDESIYLCRSGECIYRHIANQMYYICEQCYNENHTMNNNNNSMDKVEFICNKLLSSMTAISYVFNFIHNCKFIMNYNHCRFLNRKSYGQYS